MFVNKKNIQFEKK